MFKKTLTERNKQEMAKLLDKSFVQEVLDEKLAKFYNNFKSIVEIKEDVYKRHLGLTSAVFVVGYEIKYLAHNNSINYLTIFVSAHSDNSRAEAFKKTQFLYNNGFNKGELQVTKPLFYLEKQKAFFYEASEGRSLFNFFTQDPEKDLKHVFQLAVSWIKKLHQLPKGHYDWPLFKIHKMVPKPQRFIADFRTDNKEQGEFIKKLLENMEKREEKYREKIKPVLIYGDYHPENIIIKDLNTKYLKMIDLTDVSLGDPMTDLGTFLQQFDFMGHNFISRKKMNKYKEYFVETYFQKNIKDISLQHLKRINLYQSWTALRTAVFLFYMKEVENYVFDLLEDSNKYLQLTKGNKKELNIY